MSQRPLRDIPPNVNYSGEAARAWGRIDKNLDALARGNAAIERGVGMFTAVIQERVERAQRVQEEVTGIRAEAELRARFGQRLRDLDPNEPDYVDKAKGLFNETVDAISKEFTFGSEAARQRFGARIEQLRSQAMLQSLDLRERAIAERAAIELDRLLNTAAATVTGQPGLFAQVLQEFEARAATLLSAFDSNKRDKFLQDAREKLSLEYVRTLVSNRDFRAAEEALRALGERGMLSSQAVGALRSAAAAEKRQAAAEARAARSEAYNEALMTMQEARAIIETSGPIERDAAVEQAQKAVENVSRLFGPDSIQARRLNLALRSLAAAAKDTGAATIAEVYDAIANGLPVTAKQQRDFIHARQRMAADEAERKLREENPGATQQQIDNIRAQAAERGWDKAVSDLMLSLPPDAVVPAARRRLEAAASIGPQRLAATVLHFLGTVGWGAPALQSALQSAAPEAWAAVNQLRADGRPVNASTLEAALRQMGTAAPETREARKRDFEERLARAQRQGDPPPGINKANAAFRKVDPDFTPKPADAREVLDIAKQFFMAGTPEDKAFEIAARMVASRSVPATAFSLSGKEARALRISWDQLPSSLFPEEISQTYGNKNVERALAERGVELLKQQLQEQISEENRRNIGDPIVIPVRRGNAIAYMVISSNLSNFMSFMLTDKEVNVILDDPNEPGFFENKLKLAERMRNRQQAVGARQQASGSGYRGGLGNRPPIYPPEGRNP